MIISICRIVCNLSLRDRRFISKLRSDLRLGMYNGTVLSLLGRWNFISLLIIHIIWCRIVHRWSFILSLRIGWAYCWLKWLKLLSFVGFVLSWVLIRRWCLGLKSFVLLTYIYHRGRKICSQLGVELLPAYTLPRKLWNLLRLSKDTFSLLITKTHMKLLSALSFLFWSFSFWLNDRMLLRC